MDAGLYILTTLVLILAGFDATAGISPPFLLAVALYTGFYARLGRWQAVPLAVLMGSLSLYGWIGETSAWSMIEYMVIVLLAFTCLFLVWSAPIPHCPMPTGIFTPGMRRVEFVDSENVERHFYCWYPSYGDSDKIRPYLTNRENEAFKAVFRALKAPGFWNNHFKLARTNTWEDADLVRGAFPLVIFHHGGGLHPLQNFSMMEELASHGYVVCSVSHPGSSAAVLWDSEEITFVSDAALSYVKDSEASRKDMASFMLLDDSLEKQERLRRVLEAHSDSLVKISAEWARDGIAVVDMLQGEKPAVSCTDLAAAVQGQPVAYMGMSLGGSAASESCYLDKRASAGINLDGLYWNPDRIGEQMPVPFLQCYNDPALSRALMLKTSGLTDEEAGTGTAFYNDYFYEGARGNEQLTRLVWRGLGHMGFTDQALASRGSASLLSGSGPSATPATAKALSGICRAFLDAKLKGKGAGKFQTLIENTENVEEVKRT